MEFWQVISVQTLEMYGHPDAVRHSIWIHYISLLILTYLNRCISVKTSLINTKLGILVNLGVLFLTMWCYVLRVEEHTHALKMEVTQEHFNEHARVANTTVYNIYISYYISPPSLNSARAEQQRWILNNKENNKKRN